MYRPVLVVPSLKKSGKARHRWAPPSGLETPGLDSPSIESFPDERSFRSDPHASKSVNFSDEQPHTLGEGDLNRPSLSSSLGTSSFHAGSSPPPDPYPPQSSNPKPLKVHKRIVIHSPQTLPLPTLKAA